MDNWLPSAQHTWGAFPLGPVANSVGEQNFLWERGDRAQSNFDLMDPRESCSLPVVPVECLPLKGGCMVPPLATCRKDIKSP